MVIMQLLSLMVPLMSSDYSGPDNGLWVIHPSTENGFLNCTSLTQVWEILENLDHGAYGLKTLPFH